MLHGVFTGISMIKASLRHYTHVMKTRTDYLPWTSPWIFGMFELYEQSGKKIIVDGSLTVPQRYPDRSDILWQGSISDLFCFASIEQFFALWDIEEILPKVWTGIAETALFRAAMLKFLDDDVKSDRRNTSFIKKYFTWQQNDSKQSFNMLRSGVLTEEIKQVIVQLLKTKAVNTSLVNKLIRITYDFLIGAILNQDIIRGDIKSKLNHISYPDEVKLESIAKECFYDEKSKVRYIKACKASIEKVCPI